MALSRYSVNSCWMNEWALKSGEGWDVDINNYRWLLIIFFFICWLHLPFSWWPEMEPKLLRPQTMANVWCFISKARSGNRVFAFRGSSFWEPIPKMLCVLGPPLDSLLISVLLVSLRSPPSPRAEICFSLLTFSGPGLQPWLPESDEKLLLWLFHSNELYTEPVQNENTRPFMETLLWISRQGQQSIKLRVEPLLAQGTHPWSQPWLQTFLT